MGSTFSLTLNLPKKKLKVSKFDKDLLKNRTSDCNRNVRISLDDIANSTTTNALVSPTASNIEEKRDIAYETKNFKKKKINKKLEIHL